MNDLYLVMKEHFTVRKCTIDDQIRAVITLVTFGMINDTAGVLGT